MSQLTDKCMSKCPCNGKEKSAMYIYNKYSHGSVDLKLHGVASKEAGSVVKDTFPWTSK